MRTRVISLVVVLAMSGLAPVAHGQTFSARDAVLAALPPGTPRQTVDAVAAAQHRRADAESLADAVGGADGVTARLAVAARRARVDVRDVPAVARPASLSAALADLAAATGVPPLPAATARALDTLPADAAAPIGDVAAALAVAARLRATAFAGLSPADLAYVRGIADDLVTRPERLSERRLTALTGRVDLAALVRGALAVAAAVDRAGPRLQAATPALTEALRGLGRSAALVPPVLTDPGCPAVPLPAPVVALSPLLAIGLPVAECYTLPYLISVDLGGNDVYTNTNNAGGTRALLSANWLPVAVALDIDGNDSYQSELAGTTASPTEEGVEGAAELGIGILADLAGDDTYHSRFNPLGCAPGIPAPMPVSDVVDQGAALLGVGVLLDDMTNFLGVPSATNVYSSHDVLKRSHCDGTYRVVYSQGSALVGLGILAEDLHETPNPSVTTMNSWNDVQGDHLASYLVDHSQGAGSGVGILAGVGVLAITMEPLDEVPGVVLVPSGWHLDRLNSNNVVNQGPGNIGGPSADYVVRCSQGASGYCAKVPESIVDPPATAFSLGVLVDLEGWAHYNSTNAITGIYRPRYLVDVVQGSAGAAAGLDAGVFVAKSRPADPGADPDPSPGGDLAFRGCLGTDVWVSALTTAYNSCNDVTGAAPTFTVHGAQGTADDTAPLALPAAPALPIRVGTMVRLASATTDSPARDVLNCFNHVTASTGVGTLHIDLVQGAAAGTLTAGTSVSDRWSELNGHNVQNTSGSPLTIERMQGFADGALAAGVLLDVALFGGHWPSDSTFNVDNSAPLTVPPTVVIRIDRGLGYGSGVLAAGAFVSLFGVNVYNVNPGFPFPNLVVSWTYTHAVGLGAALFADVSVTPDTYRAIDVPAVGCTGTLAVFFDAQDGLDGPALTPSPLCVDV